MEVIRVLSFVCFVLIVYCTAAICLATWIRNKLKGSLSLEIPWKRRLRRGSWAMALVGFLCMSYGYWVEPYWPEVTHTRLPSSKIREPIRLVLISDLHSDLEARLENKLPRLIAAQKPDLILFAGDAVNSPDGLSNFRSCMTELARIAPAYAVRGNWDTWIWPGLNLFSQTGVQELNGEGRKLRVRGEDIWVVGVPAEGQAQAHDALKNVPPDALTVFLHHYPYPDILSPLMRQKIDLFCAGHIHGGQVALPFYGALLTLSRWGKMFERGLYSFEGMPLYVSRGVGMEGGMAPRVRFFSRPEIAVIDLVPA